MPDVWWIRDDLRLADNPAVVAAAERGPPLAVCVWDAEAMGARAPGAASRVWLARSLAALSEAIAARGGRLVLARGRAEAILPALAEGGRIHASRRPEPWARAQARRVAETAGGDRLRLYTAALLHEPHRLQGPSGGAVGTFAAFRRRLADPVLPEALPPPGRFADASSPDRLEDWPLLPPAREGGWERGLARGWTPGEAGAQARLAGLGAALAGYAQKRDRLDGSGGSGLSPHLRWGEIAPWAAWRAAGGLPNADRDVFRAELLWREFAHHRLWWDGDLEARAVGREAAWRTSPADLRAWRRGRTGVPAVDAGMRQLWREGWLSNRARLLAAAFLTRHLLLDWRAGEAWFWDTLVDACPANNPFSWQWGAGCGPDPQPFFRVLNPVLQGRRHDPGAAWIARFVPETAAWADPHAPWEAGGPAPIVDLAEGRRRALAAA